MAMERAWNPGIYRKSFYDHLTRETGKIIHVITVGRDLKELSGAKKFLSTGNYRCVLDCKREDGFVTEEGILDLKAISSIRPSFSFGSLKNIILTNSSRDVIGIRVPWGEYCDFEIRFSIDNIWGPLRFVDFTKDFAFFGAGASYSSFSHESRDKSLPYFIFRGEDFLSPEPVFSVWNRTFETGDFPLKVLLAEMFLQNTLLRDIEKKSYKEIKKNLLSRFIPLIKEEGGVHEKGAFLAHQILSRAFDDNLAKYSLPLISETLYPLTDRKILAKTIFRNFSSFKRMALENLIPLIGHDEDRFESDVSIVLEILNDFSFQDLHKPLAQRAALIRIDRFCDENARFFARIFDVGLDEWVLRNQKFKHNMFLLPTHSPKIELCVSYSNRIDVTLAYAKAFVLRDHQYENAIEWIESNQETGFSWMKDPISQKEVPLPVVKAQKRADLALALLRQEAPNDALFNKLCRACIKVSEDGPLDWNIKSQTRAEIVSIILSKKIEDDVRIYTAERALNLIASEDILPEISVLMAVGILGRSIKKVTTVWPTIPPVRFSADMSTSDIIKAVELGDSLRKPEIIVDRIFGNTLQKRAAEKAIRFLGSKQISFLNSISFANAILKRRHILDSYFCWTVENWLKDQT